MPGPTGWGRRHAASVGDDHVLVELDVHRAMWARYATPPSWPPTYLRWSVRGGTAAG
jgi:hypothetical protein